MHTWILIAFPTVWFRCKNAALSIQALRVVRFLEVFVQIYALIDIVFFLKKIKLPPHQSCKLAMVVVCEMQWTRQTALEKEVPSERVSHAMETFISHQWGLGTDKVKYQEGGEEREEGAEAEDDGVPDGLRQHRLPAEEAAVAAAHAVHHRVVLPAETQPRRRARAGAGASSHRRSAACLGMNT